MRLRALTLIQVLLVSTIGFAQETIPLSSLDPDVRALVLLRGAGAASRQQVVFARPPAGFPTELIPDDVTVRAAATAENLASVVAELPKGAQWPDFRYVWRAQRAGWVETAHPNVGFGGHRMPMLELCKADQRMEMLARVTTDERRLVSVVLSPSAKPCRAESSGHQRAFPIPVLDPPPNTSFDRFMGGGGSGGMYSLHSQTVLETKLLSADVGAHYRRVLESVGWKAEGEPLENGRLYVVQMTSTDRDGGPVVALLSSYVLEPGRRIGVSLEASRKAPVR